jgi:hypothetical protein
MTSAKKIYVFCIFLVCLPVFGQVDANYCGSIANGFGPFDYRPDRDTLMRGDGDHTHKLGLVEGAHFTKEVELLIRGRSGGLKPGGDIDYTLRAFPNHHRALISVMRYGEKEANQKPSGLRYVVECYFERAIRFSPDDALVRIIYSTYLTQNKRIPEAVAQLDQATRIAGESVFTQYNIGLAYFDMKIYDRALTQAHRALALGFERVELRQLLEKAGQWKEPAMSPDAPPPATPADTPASASQ